MSKELKKKENLKQIIEKLEQTRKDKDLSYEQVAKMINSSRSTIWKILTHLAVPNADTFLKLIDCLGFTFSIGIKLPNSSLPIEIAEKASNVKLKGNFVEESGKVDKKLIDKISKRKQKDNIQLDYNKKELKSIERNTSGGGDYKKKAEISECPNCKYAEVKETGLKIRTVKCNDCKTKKK